MASDFSKRAFAFYVHQGLPPHQAAVLAGNADWESGGRPTVPGDKDPKTGEYKSWGIFQWDAPRKAGLHAFANDPVANKTGQVLDPTAENTQLAYALHELRTSEADRAGNKFFAAPDVTSANDALMGFLRPEGSNVSPQSSHGYTGRLNNAMALVGMEPAPPITSSQYVAPGPDYKQNVTPPPPVVAAAPTIPQDYLLAPLIKKQQSEAQAMSLLAAGNPPAPQIPMPGLLTRRAPEEDIAFPTLGRRTRGLLG